MDPIAKIANLITEDPDILNEGGLTPAQRARAHRSISRYRSDKERGIIAAVANHIKSGGSTLAKPLRDGLIDIYDIIDHIKAKRCISAPNYDVGHVQAKNVVGHAIRDEYPKAEGRFKITVNDARRAFGLPEIQRKQKERGAE